MNASRTRLTEKSQTTVPKEVRDFLELKQGETVEWNIVKGMVVVDASKKMARPVDFLVHQLKLDWDAVKLVKEARGEFQ